MSDIMQLIHEVNPYDNFDSSGFKVDLQGWNNNFELFASLINEVQPKLIIEVGTWKGLSAIRMGNHVKKRKLDCEILCVDTWLGGLEHWLQKNINTRPWYKYLNLKNGYPTLYYQFVFNVISSKLHDVIVPFPTTSLIASRFLKRNSVKADLIYIDGSHEEEDVYMDLNNYYELLSSDGVIFGDDYTYDTVKRALNRFLQEHKDLTFKEDCSIWVIRRNEDSY